MLCAPIMRFKSLISLFLLAAVAALVAATAVPVSPVDAASLVQSRSAIGNLSLESGYSDSADVAIWDLTVTNHALLRGGGSQPTMSRFKSIPSSCQEILYDYPQEIHLIIPLACGL